MMTEETTWLKTNTDQAKTHFGSNYAAGVSGGKIVDAYRGWVQRVSAIMFQDSAKLKIDIVTMTSKNALGKNTLLAVELHQIWSEDMLRDPSRVGGFSAS